MKTEVVMIERFRLLAVEIFIRLLTYVVKALTRLKSIVLFLSGLKIKQLMRLS